MSSILERITSEIGNTYIDYKVNEPAEQWGLILSLLESRGFRVSEGGAVSIYQKMILDNIGLTSSAKEEGSCLVDSHTEDMKIISFAFSDKGETSYLTVKIIK
jgi:hypothetical protein